MLIIIAILFVILLYCFLDSKIRYGTERGPMREWCNRNATKQEGRFSLPPSRRGEASGERGLRERPGVLSSRSRKETAAILITRDLGVIAKMCHRVAVMYAGSGVEYADVFRPFRKSAHPYCTRGAPEIPSSGPASLHPESSFRHSTAGPFHFSGRAILPNLSDSSLLVESRDVEKSFRMRFI